MNDDKKRNNDSSQNNRGEINGKIEKSNLPDYEYTPPPPSTDNKPNDKK
ncbi:hypothetical protein GCM10007424_10530 [Flavobacterium suaedae]|uniref:Uncharacterized protein n=1 Tax=Flavobacterium suaedae TaxID=1767027 RepID=A0ABQ1JM24_9FLAO|nr:hypothetical protein [Flavobacterium suaedae]GGB72484.1 hypothetical protein GCM10007424_10530 [Flavobacterium suaedae]